MHQQSLGAPSPVQGVHPQTPKMTFLLSNPFSEEAAGKDDRQQAGGTVPCPGLDVTVPPGLGKDWQQQEGRGQDSEWGKGSNKV